MERRENSQEEDAEDVSLCDLPVLSLSKEEHDQEEEKKNQRPNDEEAANDVVFEAQEEFAFGSATGGSLSTAPVEMCAADEVFFRGQILPLRLSVSSDVCRNRSDPTRNPRSESLDRGSVTGFRSVSSRSSSCSSRSTQNSSPVTSGTLVTIARVTSEPRLPTRSHFGTHPSPKTQIRVSSPRGLERVSSAGRRQKSSMWDLFRLGLVRTPDIELQEIKANLRGNNGNKCTNYSSIIRSSSVNHNDYNTNNNFSRTNCGVENSNNDNNDVEKQKRRKFLSGCMCTADQIASNAIVVKSKDMVNKDQIKGQMKLRKGDETTSLKMEKSSVRQQSGDHDKKKKKESAEGLSSSRKQAMSHHRTYEWLKELSHANLPMHV